MSLAVVIPSFNRPIQLRKALLSISVQTTLPNEIIVVDDGSNTPIDVSIFDNIPKNINCVLLFNKESMGANYARNKGLNHSKSKWISFLDDDDEFEPNKIEEINTVISNHNDVDIIYHSATIFMVNEKVNYRSGSTNSPTGIIYLDLLVKNIIGGTSVATVKRQALLDVEGFDEKLPALQDYDLWLRLAKSNKKFHFIDKPLVKYHHETMSKSISKSLINNKTAIVKIEEKHLNEFTKLNKQQIKEHEMWKQKMRVHKSLMNKQYKEAIREQIIFCKKFPSFKSFIELFIVLSGPRMTFKLKSIIN